MTGANAQEAALVSDEGQRRRLAEFMVDISQNHSQRHEITTSILELAVAMVTVFKDGRWEQPVRGQLLGRGMAYALAGNPLNVVSDVGFPHPLLNQVVLEPEYSVEALVHLLDANQVREMRTGDTEWAELMDRLRRSERSMLPEVRRQREVEDVLRGPAFRNLLDEARRGIQVQEEEFFLWLREGEVRRSSAASSNWRTWHVATSQARSS